MKKIAILALVFAFLMTLAACGNNETDTATTTTQIGNSSFSVVLPEGYAPKEDDFDEDQVAYFYKDDNSIDFDVYQWAKGDEYTLETEAKAFAAVYGATAEAITINGINGWKYVSAEEFEGKTYTVVNYMFEDDTYIVEICFWTIDTDEEYAAVDEIIDTLKKN